MNRICNLTKLLRVTALVVTFINKLKERPRIARKTQKDEVKANALNLKEAEELWIKSVQSLSFAAELQFLRNEDSKASPPIYVKQFGLFLDEGIIKCKGRMNNSLLPANSRNPVLLLAKHALVKLIIKDAHDSVLHCGISAQAFLLAFRRFSSRRGLPATITWENAKSFKASCKEVRKITRSEEVWQFLTNKRITWNFIIDKARGGEDTGKDLSKASSDHLRKS